MDYVVFGMGMGSSLVLAGVALRSFGPALRYRTSRGDGEVLKAEELVAKVAWARFCSALGAAIALAGLFLLLVTGILMIIRVSDGAGTISIIIALAAVLVLIAVWSWAFVDRFGLYGIVRDRQRTSREQRQESQPEQTEPAEDDDTTVSVRPEPAVQITTPTPPRPAPSPSPQQPQAPAAPPLQRAAPPQPTSTDPPRLAPPVTTTTTTPQPAAPPGPVETHADPSRSRIVNPSDAAALDRILAETEPGSDDAGAVDEDVIAGEEVIEEPVREDDIPAAPWNRRKHQRR